MNVLRVDRSVSSNKPHEKPKYLVDEQIVNLLKSDCTNESTGECHPVGCASEKFSCLGKLLKPHEYYAVAYEDDSCCHFGIDFLNHFHWLNVVLRVLYDAYLTSDRATVCLLCEKLNVSSFTRGPKKIEFFVLGFVQRLSESLIEMRSSLSIEYCCGLIL